jgi:methylenetetrahydrofolate dehydrogenase (NADP+)/methenyltetrahydrofolate cyclohydrolase
MIIDGKAIAGQILQDLKARSERLARQAGRKPCLAVVLVGDNPASRIYVNAKIKAAATSGIDGREIDFPDTVTQEELLQTVKSLNADPAVDGILVQLPLPAQIDAGIIIDAISPAKDADGLHPTNVTALQLGRPCIIPCTPRGIMHLIDSTGISIEGKHAVVIGRSNMVGKPTAKLLLDRNATVTIAHSRTTGLATITRTADILVVATGCHGLIDGTMVKPGAVVIDVGITRIGNTLNADVDFPSASQVAGWITPVPGGVGPMTVAMLLENTVRAARLHMA